MYHTDLGIPFSRVSPSFLHANSTSHTWAFSAIAELIDNAYDPDVSAKEMRIDVENINDKTCLTFVDNGEGLDHTKLLKMLSFGFCEKDKDVFSSRKGAHVPIGAYGNGFKSGSMRLGKDAMVLTRQRTFMSVGLLSQTYLQAIGAETVLVPIVTWKLPERNAQGVGPRVQNNMDAILNHSVFNTTQGLFQEFDKLERANQVTKIIIYNLRRSQNDVDELDLVSDPTDIRCSESQELDRTTIDRSITTVPEFRKSLREYCSILFLTPRMKIYIRGQKVKARLISKSFSRTERDVYNPTWLDRRINITFGFTRSQGHEEEYGIMMYHRNRLIKAYEKVGCQKNAGDQGAGVVGIVQADFLQPIHNKQDFNKDEKYNSLMQALGMKLNDYWNQKTHDSSGRETPRRQDNWTWAQCDRCLKWRRLPGSIGEDSLSEMWYCLMNPDATHNRCDIDQEPECEDEALTKATYEKTYKKNQEQKKLEEKLRKDQQQFQKERELKQKEKELQEKAQRLQSEEQLRQQQQPSLLSDLIAGTSATQISILQKKLQESRDREEIHKRQILQVEEEKKQLEEEKKRAEEMLAQSRMVTGRRSRTLSPSTSNEPPCKRIALTTGSGEMNTSFTRPSSQPIVLDNSDDDSPPPGNVNPDVRTMDAQMEVCQPRPGSSGLNASESRNRSSSGRGDSSNDMGRSSRARNGRRSMAAELREKLEIRERELAEAREKLNTLRTRVYKLLTIILPNTNVGSLESIETTIEEIILLSENSE